MTERQSNERQGWAKALPTVDSLLANPLLQPVAGRLKDPLLWRFSQDAVARGVAVGIFWAFAAPFAQVLIAAAHCTFWRANIPIAAAMTMITNPFTLGFWLWLAYLTGAWLTGAPAVSGPTSLTDVSEWLLVHGHTALIGMGLFAVAGSAAGYLLVKGNWRIAQGLKRRHRLMASHRRNKVQSTTSVRCPILACRCCLGTICVRWDKHQKKQELN